ncbi:Uncharacterised protein [Shigella sonnei]|nr:Uncharacterised protein [Shigella sonnei]
MTDQTGKFIQKGFIISCCHGRHFPLLVVAKKYHKLE